MIFYSNFLVSLTLLFIYYVLQTTLIRKWMVNKFVDPQLFSQPEHQQSFSRMWRMGYRYDAKISAILLAIPFIIGAILLAFSLIKTLLFVFLSFLCCLLALISVITSILRLTKVTIIFLCLGLLKMIPKRS